jgi:hypothetical protein
MTTELRTQKDGTMKYKGIVIENTPTEKFTELVTFTKAVKKANTVIGKKFLNLEKAIKYIDDLELHLWEMKTQLRIEKQEAKKAQRELLKLNGVQFLNAVGK